MRYVSIPEWAFVKADRLLYIKVWAILLQQQDWGIPTKICLLLLEDGEVEVGGKNNKWIPQKGNKADFQSEKGQQKLLNQKRKWGATGWIREQISTTGGLSEWAGEISAGVVFPTVTLATKTEKLWFVNVLWSHFYLYVVDLKEILVGPGPEPPVPLMWKHLFPWPAISQYCIKCISFPSCFLSSSLWAENQQVGFS